MKKCINKVILSGYLYEHTLAVKTVKDKFGNMCIKAFRDHDVHKILENSNIKTPRKRRNENEKEF